MAHKWALEALDRRLKDIRGNHRLFGGALILLSGDFRQTLPVIPRSTPADELAACLKSSVLWQHVQKLCLKTNVRVQLEQDAAAQTFAEQLLDLGNGTMATDGPEHFITLPTNFCVFTATTSEWLICKVFPDIAQNHKQVEWLSERAILAARNSNVDAMNLEVLAEIPGEAKVFKSIDTVVNEVEAVNYLTKFLNSLDLPGMPPHVLTLKVGLFRNLNPPQLCNGTTALSR